MHFFSFIAIKLEFLLLLFPNQPKQDYAIAKNSLRSHILFIQPTSRNHKLSIYFIQHIYQPYTYCLGKLMHLLNLIQLRLYSIHKLSYSLGQIPNILPGKLLLDLYMLKHSFIQLIICSTLKPFFNLISCLDILRNKYPPFYLGLLAIQTMNNTILLFQDPCQHQVHSHIRIQA